MPSLKVVCVGDQTVNKMDLLIAYTTNVFPEKWEPTRYEVYKADVTLGDETYSLSLHDTCESMNLRPLTYSGADVFLACFSLVQPDTLNNIQKFWIPEIKQYCPKVPYILVGLESETRKNLASNPEKGLEAVPQSKVEEVQTAIKARAYVECDARGQINLQEVFNAAAGAAVGKQKKDGCAVA
jgi:GTPase SAR1 family protein